MLAHRSLDIEALKHVALMGGVRGEIGMTSSMLAKALSLTQQAASNRLMALEEHGWIIRRKGPRTQHIRVTDEGKKVLLGEYSSYHQIFSPVSEVEFHAELVSGMGRGQYFLSLPYYSKQFNELLGYVPYEGTLNLKVDPIDADKLSIIRGEEGHVIKGFAEDGRSFGAAECFRAKIIAEDGRSVECALVLPQKSKYWDVVEMVSKNHLRRTLGIGDGARIQVVVHL